MSCTEIYGFVKNGNAVECGRVHNSFLGHLAIWNALERKYLPPVYLPGTKIETTRFALNAVKQTGYSWLNEIFYGAKTTDNDRILIGITCDMAVVRKKDIPRVIEAFRAAEFYSNLPEQADILQKAYEDPEIIAVAWNGTSVNCDTWGNYNYDEEADENYPYNLFEQHEHMFLNIGEEIYFDAYPYDVEANV